PWMSGQMIASAVIFLPALWLAKKWNAKNAAAVTVVMILAGYFMMVMDLPSLENRFRGDQTMKPLGTALRENFQPGDVVLCWKRLPQGLPFYSGGAISSTNRPYFAGMDLAQMPFRFPGNGERLGDHLLTNNQEVVQWVTGPRRVWMVGFGTTVEAFARTNGLTLHEAARAGQWELFSNR